MNTVSISTGQHHREHCPVRVSWPGAQGPAALVFPDGTVPVQRDGTDAVFIPPPGAAGSEMRGTPGDAGSTTGVEMKDSGEAIQIFVGGEPFTVYHYGSATVRPYFWPVLAPGGIPVTRAFPMETVSGESTDHPHHKSVYCAYGDVNGVNNWDEEQGHGFTVHRSVDELISGPVFGRFTTTSDWTGPDGTRVLVQRLTVTAWMVSGTARLLDFHISLTASDGSVRFGDTKEGGILTVRVATSMDGERGGRIENSYGGVTEAETWGKPAHWCHYSGVAAGQPAGVALMDHPLSFRSPTCWHVRDYGLMAANPFGLAAFTDGAKDGSFLLENGAALTFSYRMLVHSGEMDASEIRDQYLNFVSPPRASVE